MGVYRSDDPMRDFDRWQKEQDAWEASLPRCERCGETVDDYIYDVDGELLCIDCLNDKFRKNVEDYMI
jgi:formylmethanofuran dehydrogenase subunit E